MFELLFLLILLSKNVGSVSRTKEKKHCDIYEKADCIVNYAICKNDAGTDQEMCECIKEIVICLKEANCYDNDEKECYQKLCEKYKCNFCDENKNTAIYVYLSMVATFILMIFCICLMDT